jgi:linoleoyl-CoA desaturase
VGRGTGGTAPGVVLGREAVAAGGVGPSGTVGFTGGGSFYQELRAKVKEHTSDPRKARRAQRQLHMKSGVVVAWAAASWALMVFVASSWWLGVIFAVSLGLAMAGIAFNLTHDANHGAYPGSRWLGRNMRWTLDLLGASSYVWRIKHNVVHHTYTNISGADGDIEQLPFLRLAPDQPQRWYVRFQHFYAWPLYGLFAVKWQIFGDITQLKIGNIEGTPLPWPKGKELVGFWLGKVAFLGWTIGIPLFFHSPWYVILVFMVSSFVLAFTLAVTFQLAHAVDEATFTTMDQMAAAGSTEWARHQVETTVDFAPNNKFLAWYMGGLNYQIEHHLFSKVCHTHYPSLAPMVREACEKHGVRYVAHRTLWSAVKSHARWLKRMGAAPAPTSAALSSAAASPPTA